MLKLPRFLRSLWPKSPPDGFLRSCATYEDRLRRYPLPQHPATGPKVGVVVTPWQSTQVPLLSLEIAALLHRENYRVTLVFDPTDLVGNASDPQHVRALHTILRRLRPHWQIIRPEKLRGPVSPEDQARAALLFEWNAISRMRGEENWPAFAAQHPQGREKIARHLGTVEALLRREAFSWLLIPGGIYGVSGVYTTVARRLGMDYSTFDSGVGLLRLGQQAIASHLEDIPRAFALVAAQLTTADRERILAAAREEVQVRAEARHQRQFQPCAQADAASPTYDLVVPLNIRWDSAALGRQKFFPSITDWLLALADWVQSQPGVSLCIRQHPRERFAGLRSADSFQQVRERLQSLGQRGRFVDAEEPLNTYELFRQAKVVLPHTSTVGIEAAFVGLPVILAARCYYEDFSFVQRVESAADYFAAIARALRGELQPTAAQREEAGLVYFLTQRCTLLQTPFTPIESDFATWSQLPPEQLWSRPELADLRRALLLRKPLPALRCQQWLQDPTGW